MRVIPCTLAKTEWGPSSEEMRNAQRYEFEKQVIHLENADVDSEEENFEEEKDIEDAEFVNELEMSALSDEFLREL